ncbi:MAG: transposase, partial [Rhodococcus sp. (in: high G+C Gram-positive bacteria)]
KRRSTDSGRKMGLQVRIYHPRKRAGISSCPQIEADTPKIVWAMDFQFDSTVDGKAIKIASMIDEHTRLSVLNIVERSITAQRSTEELDKAFALWGGPPQVLRMDNGPEFISSVLQQFCRDRVGISYIPPGTPWNNGHIESFNNRLRKECLNRNHWSSLLEARVVIGDFKDDHNNRHRHSSLGYLTPAEYAAQCTHTHQPVEGCEID